MRITKNISFLERDLKFHVWNGIISTNILVWWSK